MNKMEYLLDTLAEECAESAQRASKAMRFGLYEIQPGQPEDNKRRLEREVAEVVAMADMLGLTIRTEDKEAKVKKVLEMMDLSRILGTLEDKDTLVLEKERLQDALNKIHDLAGELGRSVDHPHIGAIQAWVHEVSPCKTGNQEVSPQKKEWHVGEKVLAPGLPMKEATIVSLDSNDWVTVRYPEGDTLRWKHWELKKYA